MGCGMVGWKLFRGMMSVFVVSIVLGISIVKVGVPDIVQTLPTSSL